MVLKKIAIAVPFRMGGSGSKISSAAPQARKAAEAWQNVASAAATTAKRKIQKEGQQFMVAERAQKVLDEQQNIPKRAPVNLGTAKVPEESKINRLKEVQKLQQEDSDYLSLIKDIYISSVDPGNQEKVSTEVHSDERSEELKNKLPKLKDRAHLHQKGPGDVPRGRAPLKSVIEALYNHQMNPQDWGPAEVAERLSLRESDAKDVLQHFELLEGTSIFRSKRMTES